MTAAFCLRQYIYPEVVSFYLNEYKDMYEIEDVDVFLDNDDIELPR